MTDITRRGVLAGLLTGAALPVLADAPDVSPRPVPRPVIGSARAADDLIAAARLGGTVGYVVAEAGTGRVLEASNEAVAMPPASVTKAVTTLFALEQLGPAHVFATRVMRLGPVDAGTLQGDLVLAGGGDPTFDTDKMGDLVAALAATGLRRVTGRFIAYAGALPQRDEITYTQPDFVGYNPSISGLMLNFDRVNFVWKAANGGWITQMNAEGARFVPKVSMATIEVAQRDTPKFTYQRGLGKDHWTVAATALGKEGSRWLPVRQPALYVAEVFRTLCSAQGIALPSVEIVTTLPADAIEIVAHDSEPLPDLLQKMLRYSTNVTAEAVGLTASGAGSLPGSAAVMTDWVARRLGVSAVFGDHSGLGPASQITPAAMVQVMQAAPLAHNGAMLRGLLRNQALPDAAGKEQKDSQVRVRAKSGTMNFISNLSGYIDAPGREGLVFAIFTADLPRHQAVPLADREDPEGQSAWVKRAHKLQKQLLNRWATAYL